MEVMLYSRMQNIFSVLFGFVCRALDSYRNLTVERTGEAC